MEFVAWKDKDLLKRLLVRLWKTDREAYREFTAAIYTEKQLPPRAVILSQSAEDYFLESLEGKEGAK